MANLEARERCPQCGRFVSPEAEGFYAFDPYGSPDFVVVFCNEKCYDARTDSERESARSAIRDHLLSHPAAKSPEYVRKVCREWGNK